MIFAWCPTFVFVCFEQSIFFVSIFIESLEWAFSFTSLKKLFMSLSSSFLLHTFGVGIKFNCFLKSLYSLFAKENAVILTAFPSGSDLYLIDSSMFLRNLKNPASPSENVRFINDVK